MTMHANQTPNDRIGRLNSLRHKAGATTSSCWCHLALVGYAQQHTSPRPPAHNTIIMAAASPPVVLVLGASGMLGRAVHKVLQQESAGGITYRVVGTGHSRAADLGLESLDVTDAAALSSFLEGLAPAVVVNCVAERRPDRVERDEAHARRLNVELVERLAAFAATQGFLVHISTDYVFDGTTPPYAPDDAPNPLNAYGRHKLEAEEAIRKVGGSCPICLLF